MRIFQNIRQRKYCLHILCKFDFLTNIVSLVVLSHTKPLICITFCKYYYLHYNHKRYLQFKIFFQCIINIVNIKIIKML